MAGGTNDALKIGLLLAAVVVVLGYIGFRLTSLRPEQAQPTTTAAAQGPQAAAVAPIADDTTPQRALEPLPVSTNPFRRTVATDSRSQAGQPATGRAQGAGPGLGGLTPLPGNLPLEVTPPAAFGFRVLGVVVGRDPSALVSHNGETKLVSLGDSVGDVKIVSIEAGGVRVKQGKRAAFVKVGSALDEPGRLSEG